VIPEPIPTSPFDERAGFLFELSRRLHIAGVPAARLEGAVRSTAVALRITCEIWSAPTGLLLSLGDADAPALPQVTRVLRLDPGNVNFAALVEVDRIADEVIAGRMGVRDAFGAFRALDQQRAKGRALATIGAFGLSAAAVAGLLRTSWLDIAVAGVLGLVIGWLSVLSKPRPDLAAASEAIAAIIATVGAAAFAHFVAPLSIQTVVVAALIVLMPGLTLTTSVTELASQQLVTGTARFAGAMVVLLKMAFGSVAGAQIVSALGWAPESAVAAALPVGVEVIAVLAASFSFSILFRTSARDVPLVMGSAILGYVLTRAGNSWFGPSDNPTFAAGVFFASFVMAALANLYGRMVGRPGTLVRLPGIMLLVPGSVGFRGLDLLMQRDYTLGLETGVAVIGALIALTAGLLFGSLVVPPRRYL
jgi:uncharacterized membrane protein YjjP (DUF1212 family)